MCRIAAFPPFTTRKEAISILLEFEGARNRDGVGSVHLAADGTFAVTKYAQSLSATLRRKDPFLTHMPHAGWTVCHLRAASHGGNTEENTHPFVTSGGDLCVVHNGIWGDHGIARAILSSPKIGIAFKGETDSEVAAEFLSLVGPDTFMEELTFGGVYMALALDGSLTVIKNSGSLEIIERPSKKTKGQIDVLFASTLDWKVYPDRREVPLGVYHMAGDGTLITKKVKPFARRAGGEDVDVEERLAMMSPEERNTWAYGDDERYYRGSVDTDPETGLPERSENPPHLMTAREAAEYMVRQAGDSDERLFQREFAGPFTNTPGFGKVLQGHITHPGVRQRPRRPSATVPTQTKSTFPLAVLDGKDKERAEDVAAPVPDAELPVVPQRPDGD